MVPAYVGMTLTDYSIIARRVRLVCEHHLLVNLIFVDLLAGGQVEVVDYIRYVCNAVVLDSFSFLCNYERS